MLEKVKNVLQTAKILFLLIGTPIAILAGYIYYLVNKKNELKSQLDEALEEEKLNAIKTEQVTIDAAAADAIAEYERLRGQYLSTPDPGVRQSPTSEGSTDKDKG